MAVGGQAGRQLVLHIGFHKTGTTALQETLRVTRRRLRSLGVDYPGDGRNHGEAALAVTGATYGWKQGGRRSDIEHWDRLVRAVRSSRAPGVVVSSEHFESADRATVERVVGELAPTTVLATLRPMAKILPSSWQQYVKNGLRLSYDDWLRGVLADPPDASVTPSFWRRHDHPAVLARWTEALAARPVPRGRLQVVVADEQDPLFLFRSVEALLALPPGALTSAAGDVRDDNRSLTAAETELLVGLNRRLRPASVAGDSEQTPSSRQGPRLDWAGYEALVKNGIAQRLATTRTPGADEPRIATPDWAHARVAELGRRTVTGIRALDVEVVGDLNGLAAPPAGAPDERPMTLPVDAAVEAVMGALADSRRLAGEPVAASALATRAHLAAALRDPARAWRALRARRR